MLKVNNINVYYGAIHAIKDVSFEVNDGEIVTLIGANGAGKSTTLQTVSGLLRSRTGSIEFMGKDIGAVPPDKLVAHGLAQVPEGRRVFLQMTVEENLEMGAFTQPPSTIAPNLEKVYAQFPRLKERRKQVAGTLSGGEQQMLAMSRALMSHPKLMMLDEPTLLEEPAAPAPQTVLTAEGVGTGRSMQASAPEGIDPCHPGEAAILRPAARSMQPEERMQPVQAKEGFEPDFSPEAMRQAVVMSEILTRPCERRRRRYYP